MFAIEFHTKITDGTIEVPEAYRGHVSGSVRVIILAEEVPAGPNMVDELLTHPLHVEQFAPIPRDDLYERS